MTGQLARASGLTLELQVLQSAGGFYLGTCTADGPFSRESVEYWPSSTEAAVALKNGTWTQREHP